MDSKLLLVKCITLLYRESLLLDKSDNSVELVRMCLEKIKVPEISLGVDSDREILISIKDTALKMCSNDYSYVYCKDDLLLTLNVNCSGDDTLYNSFIQGIEKDMDEVSLKRTINSIKKNINDGFKETELIEILKKAYTKITFDRTKIKNITSFVNELNTTLEPFQRDKSKSDLGVVSSLDINDDTSLTNMFNEVKDVVNNVSLLVTGWQDLNTMLQGGFRRGESWVIGALQHKYKTGFTLSLLKQIALYNKPVIITPGKKPLLLRISFEDSLLNNVQYLYQNLHLNEFNIMPNMNNISSKEMAKYVKDKLQVNGYNVKLMRVNPSSWTYVDIQNTVLDFESDGYEVHLLMLDYLDMIPTTGCIQTTGGSDIMDMFLRIRNFCSSRNITMITPHQYSTEAKQLTRDGHVDFIKKVAEKGYYRGSKQIDQGVDGELGIHIEKDDNGNGYLTVQRGKHRLPTNICDELKYTALPFPNAFDPIKDDIYKEKISTRKIGKPNNLDNKNMSVWD